MRKRNFKHMEQADIFEQVVLDVTPPPRARKSDPLTSHIAAREYTRSRRADTQRAMVLASVKMHPGSTSRELAGFAATDELARARVYDVFHRRLPELRDSGALRNGEARKCRISGRASLPWYPIFD